MSRIYIEKNHNLSEPELRSTAEDIGKQLVSRHGGSMCWEGDKLHYSLPGTADAFVEWDSSVVIVNVKLSLMAALLKPILQSEIERQLNKHI